jgi:hypothetical protein
VSAPVGPKPIKISQAFHGGLSRNWREKINHGKYLEFDLQHAMLGDILPKVSRNTAALWSLPVAAVREAVPLMAVAPVRGF